MYSGTVFTKRGTPDADLRLPRSAWALYDEIDGTTSVGTIAEALRYSPAETFAAVQILQSHDLIEEPVLSYAAFSGAAASGDAPAPRASEEDGFEEDGSDADRRQDGLQHEVAKGEALMQEALGRRSRMDDAPSPSTNDASASDVPDTTSDDASSDDASSDDVPSTGSPVGDGVTDPTRSMYAPTSNASETSETSGASPQQADEASSNERDLSTQQWRARTLHFPTLWSWLEGRSSNVKDYKNTQAFILMEASDALESIGVQTLDDLQDVEHCGDPGVLRALENAVANNLNERIPEKCYQ